MLNRLPLLLLSLCWMLLHQPHLAAEVIPESQVTRSGEWLIVTSENFSIRSRNHDLPLAELVRHCESLRAELQKTWIGQAAHPSWTPRCDVILHSSVLSYSRTLGNGAGRSVGCTSLKLDSGRVVQRRIDLRLDSETWKTDALPHELTHVVLADRFADRRIPPWIDEGIGVSSESRGKQLQRLTALQQSQARGDVLKLQDLMVLNRFPDPRYRDAFYGQSVSLIHLLHSRSEHPSQVLDFADHAQQHGYDSALREVYEIDGFQELQAIAENHRFEPGSIRVRRDGSQLESEPQPAVREYD